MEAIFLNGIQPSFVVYFIRRNYQTILKYFPAGPRQKSKSKLSSVLSKIMRQVLSMAQPLFSLKIAFLFSFNE